MVQSIMREICTVLHVGARTLETRFIAGGRESYFDPIHPTRDAAQATEAGQLESQVDLVLEKCGSVEGVGDGSVGSYHR